MTRVNKLQASFKMGEIGPDVYGRIDLEIFDKGVKQARNSIVLLSGGLERRPGTKYVLPQKDETARARLAPFIFSRTDAFVIELSAAGKARLMAPGGSYVVSGGNPYEFNHPWSAAELQALQFTQVGDDLHVVSGQRHRHVIQRLGPTSWQVVERKGENGPFGRWNTDEAKTIQASASTGSVTLTATGFTFDANLAGMLMRLEETDTSAEPEWMGGYDGSTAVTVTAGDKRRSAGHVYEALDTGEVGVNAPTHDEGTRRSGAGKVRWKYLHSGIGVVRIDSVAVGGATASATVIDYLPGSIVSGGSYRWAEGAWGAKNGYPDVIGFFDLRLLLAQERDIWGSVIDDFENFKPGTDADLSFSYTITSRDARVDDVAWLLDLERLAIGSVGGEFTMRASRLDETLTPTNRTVRQGTSEGAHKPLAAVAVDTVGIYVGVGGETVIEFAYDPASDGNAARDLTLRASHIAKGGLRDIAWHQKPWRVFWAARADGYLVGMTYRRDEEVAAWHSHEIAGADGAAAVESVAVIPTADGAADELWLTVRRVINGATRRYIEVMTPRQDFAIGAAADNAWFLDCALKLESAEPVSVVSGLSHLEGVEVHVFADGAVQDPKTVAGGAITLETPAKTVLVGLHAPAETETLPWEFLVGDGDTGGELRRVRDCVIRAIGVGGEVWAGGKSLPEPLRPTGGGTLGVGPPVYQGLLRAKLSGGWARETGVVIRQKQPFPLTILGLSVATELSEGR